MLNAAKIQASTTSGLAGVRVSVLNNYLRPHHVEVFSEVQKSIPNLQLLLSTVSESEIADQIDWGKLDVKVQNNFTWKARWKHSIGFQEVNFIHFPYDTVKQLKQFQPEIVCSYELGMRTLLSSIYCRRNKVPLVVICNMASGIEIERGIMRRMLRRLLRNRMDFCTYNGHSCKAYLKKLGVREDIMFEFPYAYDSRKIFRGVKSFSQDGVIRLMYCGTLNKRKGIQLLLDVLESWTFKNPAKMIELSVCGGGDKAKLRIPMRKNLQIVWKGFCSPKELSEVYSTTDLFLFPSLADEWGMAPIEALASGVPVLGSVYAQSVESTVVDRFNGWVFRPDQFDEFYNAFDVALNSGLEKLASMSAACRKSVEHISPSESSNKMLHLIDHVLQTRNREATNAQS